MKACCFIVSSGGQNLRQPSAMTIPYLANYKVSNNKQVHNRAIRSYGKV